MASIDTLDDIQAEFHTLVTITVLAFDVVTEMNYPEDPTLRRPLDEVTSLLKVISERMVDLDEAVSKNYRALRDGGPRGD